MSEPTPGPWEYVPSTEHHGPYVTSQFGSTICDCYMMSQPSLPSIANGGPSKPIPFMHEMADPNARLIAAAPELLSALQAMVDRWEPDCSGQDRVMWENAREAINRATVTPTDKS